MSSRSGYPGFFITGAGTDVGKTIVCAGLLRKLSRQGRGVAVKPVQTGCERIGDKWRAPDLELWRRASFSLSAPPELYCPVCLELPASPHLAAALAGFTIDAEDLSAAVEAKLRVHPWAIVEGAGGPLTPITHAFTILDLILRLNLPVLLVVDNRLGAINSSLLSLQALRQAGASVLGMVFNETSPRRDELEEHIRRDNRRTITKLGNIPILAEIPHIFDFSADNPAHWEQIDRAWENFPRPLQPSGGTA
ncbi:MAG: dethiobiotin synthase [Syntrophales bacterium]|nr:dethiobiotin synthase [Syntrophales bacterium]